MLAVLGIEAAFMAAVVAGVLHGAHTHEKRSMIVGILCVICGSIQYASNLTVMVRITMIIDPSCLLFNSFFPFLVVLF